jgi:ABC-type phosphate/phosphonate transport system substrate-binding protein
MARKVVIALGIAAVGLTAALLPSQPVAPAGTTPGTVRIGLIGSLFRDTPEPVVQVMMRPFRSLLETQTGICGDLVAAGDADNLGRRIVDDEVQFGVFHGVEFAWARQKHPQLRPLLVAVNQRLLLRAHLVVRRGGPVEGFADLKGKVVALPRRSREHCHLYLERRCVPAGSNPRGFFRRLATPMDAEDALDDVESLNADAAVVDGTDLEAYRQHHPERASRLRSLARSEGFPAAVVVYAPGAVSESLISRFRSGMIAASSTTRGKQLLSLCRITRFEEPPADYDETLTAIARAYPAPVR